MWEVGESLVMKQGSAAAAINDEVWKVDGIPASNAVQRRWGMLALDME